MKIQSFQYTDDKGKVSFRDFIPIKEPSDNYFGIDVSELGYEDQEDFLKAVEEVQVRRNSEIEALMEKFDIKYKFRTFKASRMTFME